MTPEFEQHSANKLVIFADAAEGSTIKISPRSMESGDDTGDELSISNPSPSNPSTNGKPAPTRIKIVRHRKVIVKRQKKLQSSDQVIVSRGDVAESDTALSPTVMQSQQNVHSEVEDESIPIPKPACRYGAGCTHSADPSHRFKFWHPIVHELSDDEIQANFICNECGFATKSLQDLQLHLKRKTAWSNESLVGCRVNCLIDSKEWHEGYVCQFHKSGKHRVEFRSLNEKRWLLMKKLAFYIIERPITMNVYGGEVKDNEDAQDNLAPIEDWTYCENISIEYAFAQSVLFKICGNSLQETGHLTKGHICLTDEDKSFANQGKCSLLYGELLPRGANKAMEFDRLNVGNAKTLFDLGMGTGKILIQAFLQFRNLRYVYGVELAEGRYRIAEDIVLRMVDLLGPENYIVRMESGKYIIIIENHTSIVGAHKGNFDELEISKVLLNNSESVLGISSGNERILHFQCGNMFEAVQNLHLADVVMMETDIPAELYYDLHLLLSQMKESARMLSYLDFRKVFQSPSALNFRQLDANRPVADRYPTSWSVQRGHHFYLWLKNSMEDSSTSHWGMPVAKKQSNEIDRRRAEDDASHLADSQMDICLPLFCSFFGSSVVSSRVSSPVKPLQLPENSSKMQTTNALDTTPISKTNFASGSEKHQSPLPSSPNRGFLETPRNVSPRVGGGDSSKKKKKSKGSQEMGSGSTSGSTLSPREGSISKNALVLDNNLNSVANTPRQDTFASLQKKAAADVGLLNMTPDLSFPQLENSTIARVPITDANAFPTDIRSKLTRTTSNSPRPIDKNKLNSSQSSVSCTPTISPRKNGGSGENIDERSQLDACITKGDMRIGTVVRKCSDADKISNLTILYDQSTRGACLETEGFPNSSLLNINSPKSCEALAYNQRCEKVAREFVPLECSGGNKVSQHHDDLDSCRSGQSSMGEFRRDCSDTRRTSNAEVACVMM